jgi:hypothetical protein
MCFVNRFRFYLTAHWDTVRDVSWAWHCDDVLVSASDDCSIRVVSGIRSQATT